MSDEKLMKPAIAPYLAPGQQPPNAATLEFLGALRKLLTKRAGGLISPQDIAQVAGFVAASWDMRIHEARRKAIPLEIMGGKKLDA